VIASFDRMFSVVDWSRTYIAEMQCSNAHSFVNDKDFIVFIQILLV
jgi:hypothetical protein